MSPGYTSLSRPFWKDLVLAATSQSSYTLQERLLLQQMSLRLPGPEVFLGCRREVGAGQRAVALATSVPPGGNVSTCSLPAGHGPGGRERERERSCLLDLEELTVQRRREKKKSATVPFKLLSKPSHVIFGPLCKMKMWGPL